MKIDYIKLENFIGIYNGMGKYVLEIDFTKTPSNNQLVLLQGSNGCGKTTLLSCLHPFSGTMDDRTEVILPDHNGYKEIHIIHNDNKYVICHNYLNNRKKKIIKSYIKKNGEELNDNGTVKSFEEIIERELDVNPSFFVLARIGSNVKNFIGLKPAERKNYMSKFLPDVSQYLFEYKKINEKFLTISKKIKSVTNEIDKLDDEESLETNKTSLVKKIRRSKKVLDDLLANINKNMGVLSTLDEENIINKYNEAKTKISKSKNNMEILEDNFFQLNDFFKDNDIEFDLEDEELPDRVNELLQSNYNELTNTEKKLSTYLENNRNNRENLEKEKSELEKLENELNSYKLDKDLDELKSMKEEYENSIKISKKNMASFDGKYKLDRKDEDILIIQQFLKHIQEDKLFFAKMNVINDFIDGDYINKKQEDCMSTYKKVEDEILKLEEDIKELNKEISFYQSKLPLNKILNDRPEECVIDNCKFISEALKYKNVQDNIDKDEQELKKKENKLDKLEDKLSNLKGIIEYRMDFFRLFKEVKSFSSYDLMCKLLPNLFDSKENFLKFITMDKNLLIDDFRNALDYSHYFMDLNESTNLLKEVDTNIKILESKDELIKKTKSAITKTKENISKYRENLKNNQDKISEYTEKKEDYEEMNNKLNEINRVYSVYRKSILINEKYSNIKNSLSEDIKKINTLNSEIEEYKIDYTNNEKFHNGLEKELDDVKYNIKRLAEFKKELEYLNERSKNVSIVKNALSPTKGIPLLFIDVYLKKTRDIANDLLDVAYNGKFFIEDFELTESDFFIKVVKEDGVLIKDVTLTSQGEMSLIGLAISLAIIQQSEKLYNIILIDEMDKELDESNRRAFVDILEKQLEILGIEQSFIISHNKEFDSANLDLILFKGHNIDINSKEFMNGKNIIYK